MPGGALDPREAELLGDRDRAGPTGRIDDAVDDPLALGGQLYLRATTTWQRNVVPALWPMSSPNLLDAFLDVRPNDRVRGFALGRLSYDPTAALEATDLLGRTTPQAQSRGALDQLYVNFDLSRTVFVTAGKQHVKWGVGRFWNPTDFLHPVRRDPLAPFDARTGLAMVKAHLPWEARGWNLYGLAILEDLAGRNQGPGTLGRVGGGARAEVVLGGAELAADVVGQRGHRPRFGLDASLALWELDLRGELALTSGRDAPRWRLRPGADPTQLASWARDADTRTTPQLVLGAEWSWKYSDEDALTTGAEYFFNDTGYDTARAYPVLLASPYVPLHPTDPACLPTPGELVPAACPVDPRPAFTPFYLGRHYAAAYLVLASPGRWNDTTLTTSVVANLSDGSAVLRLDHSVLVNTYLTVETWLAGHLGHEGGEFRFGGTVPAQALGNGSATAPLPIPVPVLDLGVALRIRL
ncbi:MAG: hypothetical protein IPO09_12750 [Anaeromyxobacter sp.]|nr:hypothetical protein [Anaeromyxobacter sp.]MBL0275056.1 hypothetical protein [Anaeromyxobacter sp.]